MHDRGDDLHGTIGGDTRSRAPNSLLLRRSDPGALIVERPRADLLDALAGLAGGPEFVERVRSGPTPLHISLLAQGSNAPQPARFSASLPELYWPYLIDPLDGDR
ncbi:hypothetical protein [Allosphingosinicella deserti]|uniref:Uncharacterized protein n=1 Tax=Allosphingosinicella deserti TaxID=2116704 RepID=A0A2P7QVK7_9SPHN|nr:hypothetical protein [Sphingomonas deserti]PSJ42001.1 hypothetical protein C7I55_07025 [Sphingomonas deserti]